MSTSTTTDSLDSSHADAEAPPSRSDVPLVRAALQRLESVFGQPFVLVDARTGDPETVPPGDWAWEISSRQPVLAEIARRERPEIVEQESPLTMIAVPLAGLQRGASLVALSVFLTLRVERDAEIASAARVFGVDPGRALSWARHAEAWSTRSLLRLAEATLDNLVQRSHVEYLQREIHEAVAHARDTYAELGLLHRLVG
jgi:hypothetical protein